MPPSNDLEPPLDEARAARRARSASLSVRCDRCKEPLHYPAVRTGRTPMLWCGRCGAQTPVPTLRSRLLRVALVVMYLAAVASVVLVCLKKS